MIGYGLPESRKKVSLTITDEENKHYGTTCLLAVNVESKGGHNHVKSYVFQP